MIFVKDKIYAKVWDATDEGKYLDLRISTSEKKQDGNYVNSNWFARAIGKAMDNLKKVKKGDSIVITTAKLSNEAFENKEGQKRSRFSFLIIDAEIQGAKSAANKTAYKAPEKDEEPEDEDGPW